MISQMKQVNAPDIDRYISDDYTITISFQETKRQTSVGLYMTNTKLGTCGYQEYWHYDKSDQARAKTTYETLQKASQEIVTEIQEKHIPYVLIQPYLRNRLDTIDPQFKEKSGVEQFNWYTMNVEKAKDWRDTLYGNRYPDRFVENMQVSWNEEEKSKGVTTTKSGRDTVYTYKYATENYVEADSDLSQIDGPDGFSKIRVATTMLDKYQDQEFPISHVEVNVDGNWKPMTHVVKDAKKQLIPWAVLTGLLAGPHLMPSSKEPVRPQIPQTNNAPSVPRSQPGSPPEPIGSQSLPSAAVAPTRFPEILQVPGVELADPETELGEQAPEPAAPARTRTQGRTRGIRNNNPGNIDRHEGTTWAGMDPDQSADSRFVVFEHPQDGIRAMARVLRNYQRIHRLNTLTQMINRWAPPNENNSQAYVNAVSRETGLPANEPINLNDDAVLSRLLAAIIHHENGSQPYDDQTILQGVEAESSGGRPWATQTNDMPINPSVATERSEEVPQSFIRPFDTKQVEIFDKQAESDDDWTKERAVNVLRQVLYEQNTPNWNHVAKVLLSKFHVPKEWMKFINSEFLQIAQYANNDVKWMVKYP